jgi:hypothetical protein
MAQEVEAPMQSITVATDRRTLESIFGNIEAAIHRSGPTAELLDARNGLAVYMARPMAARNPRKAKPSRNVELFLKEKFPAIYADRLAPNAYVGGDRVDVTLEHNGTIIHVNDARGERTVREYLKAQR